MSANIWKEEIDQALIEEIQRTVMIPHPKTGTPIPIPKENIIIRKPEDKFKIEVFPCVSIYSLYELHNRIRYNPEPIVVSKDPATKSMTMKDSPVPFDLVYQLDFWSKYITDMNVMTKSWMMKHFRQFNLPVKDDGGTQVSTNAMLYETPKKADLTSGDERIYHTINSYRIWVELDSEIEYNVTMVTTREVETTRKEDE